MGVHHKTVSHLVPVIQQIVRNLAEMVENVSGRISAGALAGGREGSVQKLTVLVGVGIMVNVLLPTPAAVDRASQDRTVGELSASLLVVMEGGVGRGGGVSACQ